MEIINRSYEGYYNLLYHGEIKAEESGYKYILIYASQARDSLEIFKIRGVNIEHSSFGKSDLGVENIFFD
jgi:hypothetical protein